VLNENPKLQPEDLGALQAFKSALFLRPGRRHEAGSVHKLALSLGTWRGGGYAPGERSGRRIAVRRQASPGYRTISAPQAARGGDTGGALPVYLRLMGGVSRRGGGWLWPSLAWPGDAKQVKMTHGVPAYLTRVLANTRRRDVEPGKGRSFAPPPKLLAAHETVARARLAPRYLLAPNGAGGEGELRDGVPPKRRMAREGMGLHAASAPHSAAGEEKAGLEMPAIGSGRVPGPDFADALDDYFFRQSRLAPTGGTAFDPRLSPLWAGLKLPV
jgi:hypothetical protein